MTTVITPGHSLPYLLEAGTPSIITLVDTCIADALHLRASDIHIEPRESDVLIRFRIDGILHEHGVLPRELLQEVISRVKVLSNLRTDEHQAAQDGRFRHKAQGTLDIRVSITPTYFGENAVLRLLTNNDDEFTLDTLGFSEHDTLSIREALVKSHGMILATGPTGSGKTTTLYTLIKELHTGETSIVTIEDPVEYAIGGVTQIQVNPRTSLTFAHGLRSILRQDPNVIMVGEIRDGETASIAVNAALTGHILLSTVHTNDAATTLPRLLDMGVDAYLVASTISIAIGQRLVRTLCSTCKEEERLSEHIRIHLSRIKVNSGNLPTSHFKGAGCDECDHTGYKGRIGIYEVLVVSPRMRDATLLRASAQEIKSIAIQEGMTTMLDDGLRKVKAGLTSIDEVLRITHE